ALDRGRADRPAPPGRLADRLLHAEGPRERRLPLGGDAPRAVRRVAPRSRERRAGARVRPARALGAEGRAPAAGALDRTLRDRRAPRGARAPEDEARRRRALRRVAQAAAPAP